MDTDVPAEAGPWVRYTDPEATEPLEARACREGRGRGRLGTLSWDLRDTDPEGPSGPVGPTQPLPEDGWGPMVPREGGREPRWAGPVAVGAAEEEEGEEEGSGTGSSVGGGDSRAPNPNPPTLSSAPLVALSNASKGISSSLANKLIPEGTRRMEGRRRCRISLARWSEQTDEGARKEGRGRAC